MALGGGTYTTQDKVLPGIYVNVKTRAATAASSSERGIVAVALPLTWGPAGEAITVGAAEFKERAKSLFGYSADSTELTALSELFLGASKVIVYRLAPADAAAAKAEGYGTARYTGSRGNDIKVSVATDVNDESKYVVSTYLGTALVDAQTVAAATDLKDNEYVVFDKNTALSEKLTAGIGFIGGSNGSAINVAAHQAFLDLMEGYSFHVLCCSSGVEEVVTLYENYTKRMRDDFGANFQTVTHGGKADCEGVINVENEVDATTEFIGSGAHALVYWVAGVSAGCDLSACNTNRLYDGRLKINADYTQAQLSAFISEGGKFALHDVNGEKRVLVDINSLTSFTKEKGAAYANNQVVRVVDALISDIKALFSSSYMGIVANDASGRASLWADVCSKIQSFCDIGVFSDFNTSMVKVEEGESADAVVCSIEGITILRAMAKLYVNISVQ